MPLYDFRCTACGASRDVRTDYETKKGLELLCIQCGGVMKAAPSAAISIISSITGDKPLAQAAQQQNAKACGHTYHCRCAIKLTKPNPFQKEIDKSLNKKGKEV